MVWAFFRRPNFSSEGCTLNYDIWHFYGEILYEGKLPMKNYKAVEENFFPSGDSADTTNGRKHRQNCYTKVTE